MSDFDGQGLCDALLAWGAARWGRGERNPCPLPWDAWPNYRQAPCAPIWLHKMWRDPNRDAWETHACARVPARCQGKSVARETRCAA